MKQQFRLSVLLFVFLASCTTTPTKEARVWSPTPSASVENSASVSRGVASADLFWFAHPCSATKGAPYRKYQSFALDAASGKFYGRASETADPVEIKDVPSGGGAWASVQAFLDAKGITSYCAKNAPASEVTDKPPVQGPGPAEGATGTTTPTKHAKKKPVQDYHPGADTFIPPITQDIAAYYAPMSDFLQHSTVAADPQFKAELTKLLSTTHLQTAGRDDQLVNQCPADKAADTACVHQRVFDYAGVRREMYGATTIGDLQTASNGEYEIYDYYCQEYRTHEEFSKVTTKEEEMPGLGHIVTAKVLNVEHTWPQSMFPDPKGSPMNLVEKTDLHHIFPTDTKVNGDRGNYEFAEVDHATAKAMHCSDGYLGSAVLVPGTTAKAEKYFEPPTAHKGDVARALFYFSTRYNAGMSSLQEAYLRKWSQQDPPDDREIKRNEAIYHVMGLRNPYIDHPEWVAKVPRFCRLKLTQDQAATENDCP